MEIALLEQELRDNYNEAISIIPGGFVINTNFNTNTNTVVASLMDSYHERLLKHTCMDLTQFNEAYEYKHTLTTFPPAQPIASTFVLAEWLAVKRQAETEQCNANNGTTFGTQ